MGDLFLAANDGRGIPPVVATWTFIFAIIGAGLGFARRRQQKWSERCIVIVFVFLLIGLGYSLFVLGWGVAKWHALYLLAFWLPAIIAGPRKNV